MARARQGRRRRGRRADDRRHDSAAARSGCCASSCAPYKRAIQLLVAIVVVENAARLAIPYLVKEGIDTGIPPIRESDNLEPLLVIVGIVLVATITQAVARQLFLVRSGKIGQDMLFEIRAAGVPALPGAEPGLPRGLHLGPGDLAADLRRRRDLRDARDRLRRPGHRGAHAGRHRRPAALPRREAGPGRADVRPVPGLADALVPHASPRSPTGSPARRSRWSSSTSSSRWAGSARCRPSGASRATRRSSTTSTTSTAAPTWSRSGWSRGSCPASG